MCKAGRVTGHEERPATKDELHQDELGTKFLQDLGFSWR
jgi:hypothetical protein